jgi:hypothetical protein
MNTTENNKLIAEFMSLSYRTKKDYQGWYKDSSFTDRICSFDGLKFHSDWNWLMEVVEKIEDLKHCQIDISLNWCRIGYKDTLFNYDSRNHFKDITKIESVYNACVEFIKWYNENKI